jgi:hypothetical protein
MCGLEKAHSAIGGEAQLLDQQHESLLFGMDTPGWVWGLG